MCTLALAMDNNLLLSIYLVKIRTYLKIRNAIPHMLADRHIAWSVLVSNKSRLLIHLPLPTRLLHHCINRASGVGEVPLLLLSYLTTSQLLPSTKRLAI